MRVESGSILKGYVTNLPESWEDSEDGDIDLPRRAARLDSSVEPLRSVRPGPRLRFDAPLAASFALETPVLSTRNSAEKSPQYIAPGDDPSFGGGPDEGHVDVDNIVAWMLLMDLEVADDFSQLDVRVRIDADSEDVVMWRERLPNVVALRSEQIPHKAVRIQQEFRLAGIHIGEHEPGMGCRVEPSMGKLDQIIWKHGAFVFKHEWDDRVRIQSLSDVACRFVVRLGGVHERG